MKARIATLIGLQRADEQARNEVFIAFCLDFRAGGFA
jgi:hypothetical protein